MGYKTHVIHSVSASPVSQQLADSVSQNKPVLSYVLPFSSSFQEDQFHDQSSNWQWPVQDNFLEYLQLIDEYTPIQDILNDFSEELSLPVGCRLRHFAHRWRQLGALVPLS